MPKRLLPTEYVVTGACSPTCTIGKVKLGEGRHALVHAWYEQGHNDFKIEELAHAAGFRISHGAIGRHRKEHLLKKSEMSEDPSLGTLSDLEAIEAILKKGQTQIPSWKITPTEWFKAMDIKYRMTQGSAFEGTLSAMAAAASEIEGEEDPFDDSTGQEPLVEAQEGPDPLL